MKKSITEIFLALFVCVVILCAGCRKIAPEISSAKENAEYNARTNHDTTSVPLDELIVWKKPDSSTSQVRTWIKNIEQHGNVDTLNLCDSCDNSLMLLTGPGIVLYIQGHTVSGGQNSGSGTKVPPSGEDGPVYHSLNFRAPNKDKVSISTRDSLFVPLPHTANPVKVAVLDTGVDTAGIKNQLYKPEQSNPPCISGAKAGWNFIGSNLNYRDNDPANHGTTVTRFITDQADKHVNLVEILPVKTHTGSGVATLFDILCAFAYASERNVKIINASFGFYVPRLEKMNPTKFPVDPNVRLLREYVSHYLTKKKILLVAAAGNKDDPNELATFTDHNIPLSKYPNNPRNLDQVSFYPASLARDTTLFWNVIAVTTTSVDGNGVGTVSPFQNFSPGVVDIGVNADAVILPGQNYVFNNPRLKGHQTVEGSSFACPIVAGMLCGNYYKIEPVLTGGSIMKYKIWNALGPLVSSNAGLSNKIKNGRITTRAK